MFVVKNNGTKIIHINKKAVMPGEEYVVSDAIANTPAIKALAKHNLLTVSVATAENTTETSESAVNAVESNETAVNETTPETEENATEEIVDVPKKRGRRAAATE